MDGFIDKFSQKMNSQEQIMANSEENAKDAMNDYEGAVEEIKRLTQKCAEINEATSQLVAEAIEKLGSGEAGEGSLDYENFKTRLDEKIADVEGLIHKENVRVYRNVQASVIDELKLQTEALSIQNRNLERVIKSCKGAAIAAAVLAGLALAGTAFQIVWTFLF